MTDQLTTLEADMAEAESGISPEQILRSLEQDQETGAARVDPETLALLESVAMAVVAEKRPGKSGSLLSGGGAAFLVVLIFEFLRYLLG